MKFFNLAMYILLIGYGFCAKNVRLTSNIRTNSIPAADDCYSIVSMKSLLCRTSQILRNVITNLSKSDKPFVIFPGVEIVRTNNSFKDNDKNFGDSKDLDDNTLLGRLTNYLRHHEINIEFSELIATQADSWRSIEEYFDVLQDNLRRSKGSLVNLADIQEARKKDKGHGYLLLLALTMGKFLTVLGIGSVAALAMKALGVATIALLMSGMMGAKSLTHSDEVKSSVQYVSPETHRRRRQTPSSAGQDTLAYNGWRGNSRKSFF